MVHAVVNVDQAHENGYLVEMSVRHVVGYPSGLPSSYGIVSYLHYLEQHLGLLRREDGENCEHHFVHDVHEGPHDDGDLLRNCEVAN